MDGSVSETHLTLTPPSLEMDFALHTRLRKNTGNNRGSHHIRLLGKPKRTEYFQCRLSSLSQLQGLGGSFWWWATARQELTPSLGVMPLLRSSWKAPRLNIVSASDVGELEQLVCTLRLSLDSVQQEGNLSS